MYNSINGGEYVPNIGENIKKIRKEKKKTQAQLAQLAGISRSYLGDLENNRKSPSMDTLFKLSKNLGVSIRYLIEGKKTKADLTKQERKKYLNILKNNSRGSVLKALHDLDNDIIKDWLYDLLLIYDVESASRESNNLLFNTLGFIEHFERSPRLLNKLSNLIYEMAVSDQPTTRDKLIIMDRYYFDIKEMLTEMEYNR